ncbi:MAG: NAD(P)/FAD-dependent oxidoreductase [Anaerolineales bacterium]
MTDFDFVVIGGGHNGLTAAAFLAKAGRKVLVLERRATLGGVAATEELFPGFHFNIGAPDARLLSPAVVDGLNLKKQGPEFLDSPVAAFAPQADGRGLTLWNDSEKTASEISGFSTKDGRAWKEYSRQTARFARVLAKMAGLRPPTIKNNPLGLMLAWGRLALQVRALGGRGMMEFLRALPMSTYQYLNEHFENDALKGLLSIPSVTGSMQGPRASGTGFMLFFQQMGRHGQVKGGVGRLSAALAQAAQSHGAEIQTGAAVKRIVTGSENSSRSSPSSKAKGSGRHVGVELENGEQIWAKAVLSNADPRTTFMDLLGAPQLEPRIVRRLRSLKLRGSTATVHLALSSLPDFPSAAGDQSRLTGDIVICPSLDYAERAFDDAKHRRMSANPILIARIPSLLDPGLAPAGQHAMSIIFRYAPYKLAESNWDAERERLGDLAVETMAKYSPNLKSFILNRRVITPLNYECEYGLAEGSEMHGQMGLDQLLLMRPVPGFVGYCSPVDGLYLCGAGAHPGGGVTGLPGLNAAKQALKEIR